MSHDSHPYTVLNRAVGKALHQYNMICDGDRIVVGLSGGKDSLTLLHVLAERLARVPVAYELIVAHIDAGFDQGCSEALQDYCTSKGFSLRIERTHCGVLGHSPVNHENPCFLCAQLRRKRLFKIAYDCGCNKLALGHHKDDIIETLFLNIFYAGQISTMLPVQPLFQGKLAIIRPLAFAEEKLIEGFAARQGFPALVNPCPSAGNSKRRQIKAMLNQLYSGNRKIKGNIFRAMHHVKAEYLLK